MKRFATGFSTRLARRSRRLPLFLACLAVGGLLFLHAPAARANVYATGILINGGATNVSVAAGTSITIGYLLNEAATAGVTIDIKSGSTTVRSLNLAGGSPGTLRGTNSVVWDGKDSLGRNAAGGSYNVAITAAATGFQDWTQTSFDTNAGNQVFAPRGIAVNRNPTSVYDGRVFVSNSQPGGNPGVTLGDTVGLLKLNADGSYASDGGFSDGGYPWAGGYLSPWKLEVGADDRLYVNDFQDRGIVVSFDQTITSNSLRYVLTTANYPNPGVNLEGPFLTGSGATMQIWMADAVSPSVGIRRWNLTPAGVIATNDVGTTIVQAGGLSDLNEFPEDVAVDQSNQIYTIQRREGPGDPDYRVFRFPAYTNTPETLATWKVGSADDNMGGAYGVSVDPTARYVSVAFRGTVNPITFADENGSLRVFSTSNGAPVVTLTPGGSPWSQWDTTWDNVGNLYTASNDDQNNYWRVFSPPGSNQATTVSVPVIQVIGTQPMRPVLGTPSYVNGFVQFSITGEANVTYIIQASTNLMTWAAVATNNSVFAVRQIIPIPMPPDPHFFRALVGPYSPASPVLLDSSQNAGKFRFTLYGEPFLTYAVQASSDMKTWGTVTNSTSTNAARPLEFNLIGDARFFRARLGQ